MAETFSKMIDLGTKMPEFILSDTNDNMKFKHSSELTGKKATVVMFICNHCPFVKHINHELKKVAEDYLTKDVNFIAISSNDIDRYPEDGPERMAMHAERQGYPFPYLYDPTQETAKAFEAACTPDFFIFNSEMKLAYRGQLDDSRPGNGIKVTGSSLRKALDEIIIDGKADFHQLPSIGCGIKWK